MRLSRLKIKTRELELIIILTFVYFICFVNLIYVPKYNNLKYAMIAFVAFFLLRHYKKVFRYFSGKTGIVTLIFTGLVVFSSWLSRQTTTQRNTFFSAIVFVATILCVYLVTQYISDIKRKELVFKLFFFLTLFLLVINDFLVLTRVDLFRYYQNYFLGTKFRVSYMHIYLLAFYLLWRGQKHYKNYIKRPGFIALSVWGIIMCLYVDCATGLVGMAIFLLVLFLLERRIGSLQKPKIFITLFLLCSLFIFSFAYIVSIPAVEGVITNVLGRSADLTGRTRIYTSITPVLQERLWLGYGYGSSFEVLMGAIKAPNTQNGLIEWVYQGGILSALLILVLSYISFIEARTEENNKELYAICAVLYTLVCLSSIEVTIGMAFFGWLFLLVMSKDNRLSQREGADEENYRIKRNTKNRIGTFGVH